MPLTEEQMAQARDAVEHLWDERDEPSEELQEASWQLLQRERAGRSGHVVYFIRSVCGGPVKIGRAKDLDARLRTLQTGCPMELEVIGWLPGAAREEGELHERFKHLRAHGEWFRSEPELLEYIEGLSK